MAVRSLLCIMQDRVEDLQKYVEVLKQEKEAALGSSGASSLVSPGSNIRRVSGLLLVSMSSLVT